MPINITPLDDEYIKLGRVARLISDEEPTIEYEDVMDMFTRAVFSGALDPPPADDFNDKQRAERNKEEHWLQVLIEAPFDRVTKAQAAIDPKPSEYFGAARDTILNVMHCNGALPGDSKQWDKFLALMGLKEEAFGALVRIPFIEYPENGRSFLEDIRAPKEKLRNWFELREKPVPWFLGKAERPTKLTKINGATANGRHVAPEAINGAGIEIATASVSAKKRKQGRPKKSAWVFIEAQVKSQREEFPKKQKKEIAFDVWRLAREKFDKTDVPSAATIQRKICEILGE